MPELKTRADLFFRTGWVFATANEYPVISDVSLVQRFRARVGDFIHDVRLDSDGLGCSCPGWRKRGKCWHVRWVLRWNFSGSELGRYLVRLPNQDDAKWCLRHSWRKWFEDHVAVVSWTLLGEETREARLAHLPPSIRS